MKPIYRLAELIDSVNTALGQVCSVFVLAAALICAGNAFIRYGISMSSNAWLEIQWYLFAAVSMLGASVVLKLNEHVRVDIIYGRLSTRRQVMVDLFGLFVFLLPICMLLVYLSWPLFTKMLSSGEMSSNAGGLVRWPAMMLLPLGFGLLTLQGLSEIIKRIGFLRGEYAMSTNYEKPLQ